MLKNASIEFTGHRHKPEIMGKKPLGKKVLGAKNGKQRRRLVIGPAAEIKPFSFFEIVRDMGPEEITVAPVRSKTKPLPSATTVAAAINRSI